MDLLGWDNIPNDCVADFEFEKGPFWLKVLASLPYFEKFAYPLAVKRGLGIIWSTKIEATERQALEAAGWKVYSREKNSREKFREGSLALLTNTSAKQRTRNRPPRFSLTRWGRIRARRKNVHKYNGTFENFKNRTYPPGLI